MNSSLKGLLPGIRRRAKPPWQMSGRRRRKKIKMKKLSHNDFATGRNIIDHLTTVRNMDILMGTRPKERPFKGCAGKMMEMMMKGMALSGVTKEILITQHERRKNMLTKAIRITAYNVDGRLVTARELTEIAFHKDGSMAMLPSTVFKDMLKEVMKGGAIFIEKVWVK